MNREPNSRILISATPEAFYVSVAEIPMGWRQYIMEGTGLVCPKGLAVGDMLKVQEYGAIFFNERKAMTLLIMALVLILSAARVKGRSGARPYL